MERSRAAGYRRWIGTIAGGAALALLAGCASEMDASRPTTAAGAGQVMVKQEATTSAPASAAAGEAAEKPPAAVPRKIIYTAEIDLGVENLAKTQDEVRALLRTFGGFVASMEITGDPGSPRNANWKLRVPVASFDAFMQRVSKLGEVHRVHSDSQDVTAEYYDLDAHLANKKVEEQRLLAHLKSSTGKLTDILLVEKEISRVRGEIEELQGHLRLMSNQTELTTVTLTASEARTYVPPQSPTFGTQAARTFRESLGMLGTVIQSMILMVIGLAPWLAVVALLILPVWLLVRRNGRGRGGR